LWELQIGTEHYLFWSNQNYEILTINLLKFSSVNKDFHHTEDNKPTEIKIKYHEAMGSDDYTYYQFSFNNYSSLLIDKNIVNGGKWILMVPNNRIEPSVGLNINFN